jgi:DNA-binding transcriptional ArsR family regulator
MGVGYENMKTQSCKPDRKKLERFLKGQDIGQQVEIFKLLSNPIRLKIALLLSRDAELCTCDLEDILGCEQTLISHHMRAFKDLGLVKERREGKWKHYSLKDEQLKTILKFLK